MEPRLAAAAWHDLGRIVVAHVLMLRDEAILDDQVAAAVLTALDGVARGEPPAVPTLDAVIAAFDERLDALTPAGAVGAAALGRGRADVIATLVRLALRSGLLDVAARLEGLRGALLDLAAANAVTLMPAYIAGQAAQPTTLGHFLGGVIAPLGRAGTRLTAAYEVINQSPLGAAALAASDLDISRERVATLLGFDGPVPNTYDAVSASDHIADAAEVVGGIAATIGRFLDELLTWLRTEPGSLRLADAWVAPDPGLPQLRAPAGLAALATAARRIEADGGLLMALARRAPYGPLLATSEAAYAPIARLVADGTGLANRAADLIAAGIEVNRAYLANRAGRAYTTSSDLADFLMIEEQLEPAAARNIAALTIARAVEAGVEVSGITPELIDAAALAVLGRELRVEFETISRYLAPRRFVERRTATGAPSPAATRAYLDLERTRLTEDVGWREGASKRLVAASDELDRLVEELIATGVE